MFQIKKEMLTLGTKVLIRSLTQSGYISKRTHFHGTFWYGVSNSKGLIWNGNSANWEGEQLEEIKAINYKFTFGKGEDSIAVIEPGCFSISEAVKKLEETFDFTTLTKIEKV